MAGALLLHELHNFLVAVEIFSRQQILAVEFFLVGTANIGREIFFAVETANIGRGNILAVKTATVFKYWPWREEALHMML